MANDIELTAAINFETNQASAGAAKQAVDAVASGAKNAAAEVGKVKPGEGTAKEFERVKGSAEKSFAAIDSARQVTEGGIMGIGQAVKNFAGQFPALQAAMGPIGLALAAFAIWKKAIDETKEAWARLAAGIRQINLENVEAKIRRTAEAFDQERESIDRLADARQRLSDLEQSKDDAQLRSQLAALELKRAQDKAILSPDDSIGARKLDLDYADKAGALKDASDQRRSERETTKYASALSDLLDKMRLAQATVKDLTQDFTDLSAQREKIKGLAMSKQMTWSTATPEMAAIDAQLKDVSGKLKTAYDAKTALETPIIEMRGKREVAEMDRKTLGTQSQTRQTDAYVTAMGIDKDSNTQMQDLVDQLDEAAASDSAIMRNWIRQQIAAKQQENSLNAAFMQQMIDLANDNAKATQDALTRASRL